MKRYFKQEHHQDPIGRITQHLFLTVTRQHKRFVLFDLQNGIHHMISKLLKVLSPVQQLELQLQSILRLKKNPPQFVFLSDVKRAFIKAAAEGSPLSLWGRPWSLWTQPSGSPGPAGLWKPGRPEKSGPHQTALSPGCSTGHGKLHQIRTKQGPGLNKD